MKFDHTVFKYKNGEVAPLVGAWIEIVSICRMSWARAVAPLVGAWIEILRKASLS